jgi:hypothetical protein
MRTLMYAVGTPIAGSTSRTACVYFRPKTSSDKDYLRIVYGNGCSSTVMNHHSIDHYLLFFIQPGYWPGYAMTLTLQQNGCFYSGIIQHELTHALGRFNNNFCTKFYLFNHRFLS